jgi:hypothetical protein
MAYRLSFASRTLSTFLHTIIQKNLKNWKDCLHFIEFAYNRSVDSTTDFSPLDLLPCQLMKRLVLMVKIMLRW